MKVRRDSIAAIGTAFTLSALSAHGADVYPSADYTTPISSYKPSARTEGNTMTVDDRLLDAKIQASEAKTDSKFSQVMAELRVLGTHVQSINSKVDSAASKIDKLDEDVGKVRDATSQLKWNIVAAGLTLGGLFIAIAAYGNQMLELAAGIFAAGGGIK